MMSLKVGYRILNCFINLWSSFWFLSFAWGLLKIFSKSFLLQLLFHMLIPIWNSLVSVVVVVGFCLSEWYNRLCENWAGVR